MNNLADTERPDLRAATPLAAAGAGTEPGKSDRPVLILTIANGAGHIRVAAGLTESFRELCPSLPVRVVDVADYMNAVIRFTHVDAYLWLVKHSPRVWGSIDRYQKRRPQTSPEWFYRYGCRALFEMARRIRPRALIATEVGCCELASLIKRDLGGDLPMVAVNSDPDADRSWVRPEVDLYCFVTEQSGRELLMHGAPPERTKLWGPVLADGFRQVRNRAFDRRVVCRWLSLDLGRPIVLVAGGSEGLGDIEEITARLLGRPSRVPQMIVLTGNNRRLKQRCENLANDSAEKLRVLGWLDPKHMPKILHAADLAVSKLGNMFNEAMAAELPVISSDPLPGAESIQHKLLGEWNVGVPVRHATEAVEAVDDLLTSPTRMEAIRKSIRERRKLDASAKVAGWLRDAIGETSSKDTISDTHVN